MRIFEIIGFVILMLLAGLVAIFVRREAISRSGGTIEMNMRLSTFVRERGWAPGLCRFAVNELRWYRLFSLSPRPRRVLRRQELVVESKRAPEGAEHVAMPPGWVVLHCKGASGPIELALAESALNGFLSWLEAAPPNALRR